MIRTILGVAACAFVMCDVVTVDTDQGGNQRVEDLKIQSNEITGWQEVDPKPTYIGDQLKDLTDGDAEQYLSFQLQETFVQDLVGAETRNLTAYIMDFGTPEKAKTMYDEMHLQYTGAKPIEGIPIDQAFFNSSSTVGGKACGVKDRFYFELRISGFPSPLEVEDIAEVVMKTYFSKVTE